MLTLGLNSWSRISQSTARRNAMVALTVLAQRRAEREEVESFLAGHASREHRPEPAPAPRREPS